MKGERGWLGACRKAACGAERRTSRGATVSLGGSGPPSELEGGPGVGRRGEKGPDPNPAFIPHLQPHCFHPAAAKSVGNATSHPHTLPSIPLTPQLHCPDVRRRGSFRKYLHTLAEA